MQRSKLSNYRSTGENYDKFKFAFNIEQKFILQQNKLENVLVSNYEKSHYLPPDIFIKSQFVQSVVKSTSQYNAKATKKYMKTVTLRARSPDFSRLNGERWEDGASILYCRSLSPQMDSNGVCMRSSISPVHKAALRPISSCAYPKALKSLTVRSYY